MELEMQFDAAMLDAYQRSKNEVGYNATRFLQMLHDNRGIRTAQILLHADSVSDGYTKLWENQRLDLTVEALVMDPRFTSLFTEDERRIARQRLTDYGYEVDQSPE